MWDCGVTVLSGGDKAGLYGKSWKQEPGIQLWATQKRGQEISECWVFLGQGFSWRCGWEHIWAQGEAADSPQYLSILVGLTGGFEIPQCCSHHTVG